MKTVPFVRNFLQAAREQRRAEDAVLSLLPSLLDTKYIRKEESSGKSVHYLKKNFFSILFLSVYAALHIPKEKRIFYGIINHCLRGLVTGTDNLLDNEYKEMLPLNFAQGATRFKSVMHILLFDRVLFAAVNEMVNHQVISPSQSSTLHDALFSALVPIGAEEAMEEGGVTEILRPDAILKSVHMYKGGKLLCLAFVAPLVLETDKTEMLQQADRGIYSIGLALQVIDDLTDFYDDIRDQRHNYLLSVVYHEGNADERNALVRFLENRNNTSPAIENQYKDSVKIVMERAIGEAVKGFDLLASAGYWLERKSALRIIRQLFRLRGVKNLLPFFPADKEIKQTLT